MACHNSTDSDTIACKGYLAREGWSKINVRLLLRRGEIENPSVVLQSCKDHNIELEPDYPTVLGKLAASNVDSSGDSNTSMNIKYPTRSEFIDSVREGVKLGRSRLEQGRSIEVKLKPGGYKGKWFVIIHPDDPKEFKVVGTMKDPTRFPQRTRVAAWRLFEERIYGRFVIELDRESGIVMIKRDN